MHKKDIDKVLGEAVQTLREGGVILYPTDTVWGLGCDATNPEAVSRIFGIKRRPDSKSLVLLASDLDQIARYVAAIPPMAIDLVEVNDKPMTIIYPGAKTYPAPTSLVPASPPVPVVRQAHQLVPEPVEGAKADKYHLAWNAVADDGTVGIRIPMMEFCRNMAGKLGRPVVSTSANISGQPTPRIFKDIPEEIKAAVDYIVDPRLEAGATGEASQIIKIGLRGEVEIIRP